LCIFIFLIISPSKQITKYVFEQGEKIKPIRRQGRHLEICSIFSGLIRRFFYVCILLFKSYDQQQEEISKEVSAYRELLERSDVLKTHVDSIYYKMDQLDINKVDNDIFLRTILDNVRDARNIMGKTVQIILSIMPFL
jgi:hypothetical protein